ncbi:MAG: carotenoid oxygenase family protein [Halioglobus sp.]|nr:carotenoid oxygenase family protein [Halioglobus sp.]
MNWDNPLTAHCTGFRTMQDDMSYVIPAREIDGTIPDGIRGIFLRAGPARNELAGQPFGHWFDGDGGVSSFRIENGQVHYRCSFVKTPKYLDESAAQKVVYRSYGHNAPGGFFKNFHLPANCANTSVVYHGGKLLALFEGGRPWRLDLDTLQTMGEEDFDGALRPRETYSAHGKVHPDTGDYINFGMAASLTGPRVDLFRVAPDGRMAKRGSVKVDRMAFCHDNAMTKNFLILMVMPVSFKRPLNVMLARETIDQNMEYQPELGMKVYVVALEDFSLVRTFEVDPFTFAHCSNAWEDRGELFVDVLELNQQQGEEAKAQYRDIFHQPFPATGKMQRYRFNIQTGAVSPENLPNDLPCEFPQWDWRRTGRPSRYIYTAGICQNDTPGFYNALQRIDLSNGEVKVFDAGCGRFVSEGIFVPRKPDSPESDGYLLSAVYDANTQKSELLILDADSLSEPIATVRLRNHIPHGFHGGWSPL